MCMGPYICSGRESKSARAYATRRTECFFVRFFRARQDFCKFYCTVIARSTRSPERLLRTSREFAYDNANGKGCLKIGESFARVTATKNKMLFLRWFDHSIDINIIAEYWQNFCAWEFCILTSSREYFILGIYNWYICFRLFAKYESSYKYSNINLNNN